jgi:hypothetical protein
VRCRFARTHEAIIPLLEVLARDEEMVMRQTLAEQLAVLAEVGHMVAAAAAAAALLCV